MTTALDLLALPFAACLVLAGLHVYFGLHVLARGVIFVDLALAQVAALGMTTALLAGYTLQSAGAYYYALAFTGGGAAIFALTRTRGRHREVIAEEPAGVAARRASRSVPQEAIIGIVYAVAAALTVLVLDRVPQGGEQIKQLLVGSILGVTAREVAQVALLYAAVGALHWLCRRPLLALSFGEERSYARLWDFLFYFTFGLVVTSSVQIAGVLLVFSFLIVPAVVAALLASTITVRLLIGWSVAVAVSVIGLAASYRLDLPTGAAVVAMFGLTLTVVGAARAVGSLVASLRRYGARALLPLTVTSGVLVAIAGGLLAAFPRADHYWLTALEGAVPIVRTAFLTSHERGVWADSSAALARAAAELLSLQRLQIDAQWGSRELDPEQRERLRQFLAGRSELMAGDRAVLRVLRQRARERQRYALGIPFMCAGVALAAVSLGLGRSSRARRAPLAHPTRETAAPTPR